MDLATHYEDQLAQAGWTRTESEQTEHSAWSTWQFRDEDGEEWLAVFYLFKLAGVQARYQLSLRADIKEAPPNWFLYAPLS